MSNSNWAIRVEVRQPYRVTNGQLEFGEPTVKHTLIDPVEEAMAAREALLKKLNADTQVPTAGKTS